MSVKLNPSFSCKLATGKRFWTMLSPTCRMLHEWFFSFIHSSLSIDNGKLTMRRQASDPHAKVIFADKRAQLFSIQAQNWETVTAKTIKAINLRTRKGYDHIECIALAESRAHIKFTARINYGQPPFKWRKLSVHFISRETNPQQSQPLGSKFARAAMPPPSALSFVHCRWQLAEHRVCLFARVSAWARFGVPLFRPQKDLDCCSNRPQNTLAPQLRRDTPNSCHLILLLNSAHCILRIIKIYLVCLQFEILKASVNVVACSH
jgi:hypothetical protein